MDGPTRALSGAGTDAVEYARDYLQGRMTARITFVRTFRYSSAQPYHADGDDGSATWTGDGDRQIHCLWVPYS